MLIQSGRAAQDAKAVNLYAKRGVAIREFKLRSGYGTAEYLLCNSMDLPPRKFRAKKKKTKKLGEYKG